MFKHDTNISKGGLAFLDYMALRFCFFVFLCVVSFWQRCSTLWGKLKGRRLVGTALRVSQHSNGTSRQLRPRTVARRSKCGPGQRPNPQPSDETKTLPQMFKRNTCDLHARNQIRCAFMWVYVPSPYAGSPAKGKSLPSGQRPKRLRGPSHRAEPRPSPPSPQAAPGPSPAAFFSSFSADPTELAVRWWKAAWRSPSL